MDETVGGDGPTGVDVSAAAEAYSQTYYYTTPGGWAGRAARDARAGRVREDTGERGVR